jgi:hypothetical protein
MQLELWGRQPTTRHNVFFGLSLPAAKAERIMQLMQGIVERLCLRATLRPVDLLHVSLVGVGDFTGPLPVGMIEAAKVGVSTLGGFRMPARHRLCRAHGGRRPEA